jgi:hypothetical protein
MPRPYYIEFPPYKLYRSRPRAFVAVIPFLIFEQFHGRTEAEEFKLANGQASFPSRQEAEAAFDLPEVQHRATAACGLP